MARVRISDHAVIRYLERHYGFDFEKVRRELDRPAIQLAGDQGCKCVVKTQHGRLVVENRTVVTFLPTRKAGRRKVSR